MYLIIMYKLLEDDVRVNAYIIIVIHKKKAYHYILGININS